MNINKEWHMAHPMPQHPTLEQRISWHMAHAKNCACRPIPDNLMQIIRNRENTFAANKHLK